eukprot:3468985-Karenia_brevis.AAC.1
MMMMMMTKGSERFRRVPGSFRSQRQASKSKGSERLRKVPKVPKGCGDLVLRGLAWDRPPPFGVNKSFDDDDDDDGDD